MTKKPICTICKHWHRDAEGWACAAFTKIPEEILLGDNEHSKPLPGQGNDIIFEPTEGAKKLM